MLLGALCKWEVPALLVCPSCPRRCAFRWTRPLGVGRWRQYLCGPLKVHWLAQISVCYFGCDGSESTVRMTFVLAFAGQPSLHGYYACSVHWVTGALR